MMKFIDMHTHTIASDGSMKPDEIIRYAKSRGLSAIAITDHDTTEGIKEAINEGNKIGLEVIPGVEISTDFSPEMHILGYFFNDNYEKIEVVLDKLRQNRSERNQRLIKKLNEIGIDITLEEVMEEAKGAVAARPHFARVMMNKGYVSSIKEAFDKYLMEGKPGFVPKAKFKPEEGIGEIAKAGGIPVLAHPIYLNRSYDELDKLFEELVKAGLKGIEAYYVDNTDEDTENLVKLAGKHNLLITGGSDFHGRFKPGIDIGVGRGNLRIPYRLLEDMKKLNP